MRFLSLFSGIEAASVAREPLGWQCVGVAEIEPFPCAVLKHRYPQVPNLGDVTKVHEADIAMLGPIDLVVFGSPCQDLSVAGKRAGLEGARSGLFHEAIRIVSYARKHCGTRFALWENVPGAFSSNKGRDFAVVLAGLAGTDVPGVPDKGWGTEGAFLGEEGMVEWATLDAQWFGVAQRRRRCFALADFGDWERRAAVLLESESLRGDSPPPGEETDRWCVWWDGREVAQCLDAVLYKGQMLPEKNRFPVLAIGVLSCLPASARRAISAANPSAELVELTTPSANVLDHLRTISMSTAPAEMGAFGRSVLRKATPEDAEALMGFPRGHTAVGSDTARYKARGNSMAVPVMRWIGKRLNEVLAK